ncbi:MAG TPA: hypothetical protein VHJ18_22525 [Streptosporangiaceae bacterium]|jgi:hypothetical protein|nr:hypothetical protein [Streptosporangiaceae bacterium]
MSGGDAGALRLSAVAALVDLDLEASRAADAWISLDGEPCSEDEAELIVSATGTERRLAEALRGPPGTEVAEPEAVAMAGLVRLAADSPPAPALAVGLLQKFLIPDDSLPAPARDERAATFSELYRMLALPGMPADAAGRAVVLLDDLGG